MGNWTLETIAWDRFDASKVDPEILRNIKAAALVERNGSDYGIYLARVFADDPQFMAAVDIGDMVRPIPAPSRMKLGSSPAKVVPISIVEMGEGHRVREREGRHIDDAVEDRKPEPGGEGDLGSGIPLEAATDQ